MIPVELCRYLWQSLQNVFRSHDTRLRHFSWTVYCLKMLHSVLRHALWYPMLNLCFLCHEPPQAYNSYSAICSFRRLIVIFMHEQLIWFLSTRTTSFLETHLDEILFPFPVSRLLNFLHLRGETNNCTPVQICSNTYY